MLSHVNHLVFHLKIIKKLKGKYLIVIGQSSLPILNRSGSYMYWDNCWLNNFNQQIFFTKTLFLENFFKFIFCDRIFQSFFKKDSVKIKSKSYFFQNIFLKKLERKNLFKKAKFVYYKKKAKNKSVKNKSKKYNFTRVWFIKYNNFILLTTFVFFYFRIKNKKSNKNKKSILQKVPLVFWRKKKQHNFKKIIFRQKNHLVF